MAISLMQLPLCKTSTQTFSSQFSEAKMGLTQRARIILRLPLSAAFISSLEFNRTDQSDFSERAIVRWLLVTLTT